MDTGSSRGPTPGPDRLDGALTPDMMDPNKVNKIMIITTMIITTIIITITIQGAQEEDKQPAAEKKRRLGLRPQ